MIEPGWYRGDGDPVGTLRYWDGAAWTDQLLHDQPPAGPPDPFHGVLAPTHAARPAEFTSAPARPSLAKQRDVFPLGLRVIAITLSVVKGASLLPVAVLLLIDADDVFSGVRGSRFSTFYVAFLLIVVLGALLGLAVQFRGAVARRAGPIVAPAFALSLIDAIPMMALWSDYNDPLTERAWTQASRLPELAVTVVFVAQVAVFFWSFQVSMRQDRR